MGRRRRLRRKPADTIEQPIVGGDPVPDGAWPNVVGLDVGCTGVLVHERVLLYSAHCGTGVQAAAMGATHLSDAGGAGHLLGVDRCQMHPDRNLEVGFDVAFCELEVPAPHVTTVPIVESCERAEISVGSQVVLVGFGLEAPEGAPGTKRAVQAVVQTVGPSLFIGGPSAGTCRGDSGSPAFVDLNPEAANPDWRLLGVLSEGKAGQCGGGWYSDLVRSLPWLERESGVDLTPCSADGDWAPDARCVSPDLDGKGRPTERPLRFRSTCGDPFIPARGGNGCAMVVLEPDGRALAWIWVAWCCSVIARRACRRYARN